MQAEVFDFLPVSSLMSTGTCNHTVFNGHLGNPCKSLTDRFSIHPDVFVIVQPDRGRAATESIADQQGLRGIHSDTETMAMGFIFLGPAKWQPTICPRRIHYRNHYCCLSEISLLPTWHTATGPRCESRESSLQLKYTPFAFSE